MSTTVQTASDVSPFQVDIPDEKLAELTRRISATRWPSRELVGDRSQGVQLATLQALARYWTTEYDWQGRGEAQRLGLRHRSESCVPEAAGSQLSWSRLQRPAEWGWKPLVSHNEGVTSHGVAELTPLPAFVDNKDAHHHDWPTCWPAPAGGCPDVSVTQGFRAFDTRLPKPRAQVRFLPGASRWRLVTR
jgi:Epoxide hydrolase N terminus